jgi:hypothetical protein
MFLPKGRQVSTAGKEGVCSGEGKDAKSRMDAASAASNISLFSMSKSKKFKITKLQNFHHILQQV